MSDDDVAKVQPCRSGDDRAGCADGVPERMPGDPDPRRARRGVRGRPVRGAVRRAGPPGGLTGTVGAGVGAAVRRGLSDRQAADAVRARIDWKYALGLELTDTGFDASVLSEFRARLLSDDQAERLLGQMLDRLRERGLLVRGGRQRTDATHVLAAVRELGRLELVIETLRAALDALAAAAPSWLMALVPADWFARYGQRASDWRLPKAEAARAALAASVGVDGFALLEAVYADQAPAWLRQVPAVQTLRMTWLQRYYRDGQGLRWRGKAEQPPGALAIGSPYDPRPATGSNAGWAGAATRPTSPRPASPTGPT